MIIVDTNVWIDHLHRPDPALSFILDEARHRVHPYVIGEVALGSLRDWPGMVEMLGDMPQAEVALHEEVLRLVAKHALQGRGIGYVDAHLLASAKLMPGSRIWTRDKRLAAVAEEIGVSYRPLH